MNDIQLKELEDKYKRYTIEDRRYAYKAPLPAVRQKARQRLNADVAATNRGRRAFAATVERLERRFGRSKKR